MNIYQKQVLFDQLLDEVNTTRIDIPEFLRLINLAKNDIVDSRIDPIKNPRSQGIYLQAVQRIREELRTLVKKQSPITESSDVITLPTDYKHYLLLKVEVDGIISTGKPITYDWLGANEDNPHTKPSDDRIKFIETVNGIELYRGSGTIDANDSTLHYIKEPDEVLWDETAITVGATTNGQEYVVTVAGATTGLVFGGNTYGLGEGFTGDGSTPTYDSGTLNAVTNTDLPQYLHDEIVRKAVEIQLAVMGEPNRKQLVQVDEVQS